MKKHIIIYLLLYPSLYGHSQNVRDLFSQSYDEICYLGIDFSHVKLIGNFTEFLEAGERNVMEIRNIYFPRWNMVVVNEREKYDISGMLRKDIYYDLDMITAVNSQTKIEDLESYNAVRYTEEDIAGFVSQYDLKGKEGIGVIFIAESLNKSAEEAVFHFVALNMRTGEVLFQRRLRGEPKGFGLRNYWINSLYRIINDVKYYYYNEWRISSVPKGSLVDL